MSQAGVLTRLLREEKYVKARDAVVRYLAAYKVIEQNLAIFDKLARCRDASEFVNAIYEGVRVKDRVLYKLVEGVKKGEIEVVFEYEKPEELGRIFDFGQESVTTLLELANEDPRTVGATLAVMALSYAGLRSR